jgi:hypothetical protein
MKVWHKLSKYKSKPKSKKQLIKEEEFLNKGFFHSQDLESGTLRTSDIVGDEL